MTELDRLFGIFFEPGKVFADVAQRPRWIAPVLISILFGLGFTYALSTHIGWEQTVRKTLANNPRMADLTPAQREEAVARGAKFGSIVGWIGATLGTPIFLLLIAGPLTGIFSGLLGAEIRFVQGFAITAYAMLVRCLYTVLLVVIMYLKPPEDFNIQVSPFSPAAYMNRLENPKWLMALAGSLDLFTIWAIILLALGFSVASRKISFTKSLITVLIPWLILVIAGMLLQSVS